MLWEERKKIEMKKNRNEKKYKANPIFRLSRFSGEQKNEGQADRRSQPWY